MDASTREFVRRRAGHTCEYCRIPQAATHAVSFHVEHTIAKQHGGSDDLHLLALSCDRCNAYKGPNISSIDPLTSAAVSLFNPRTDEWTEHFEFHGGEVVGRTPCGRATVRLLNRNARRRVQLREEWLLENGAM